MKLKIMAASLCLAAAGLATGAQAQQTLQQIQQRGQLVCGVSTGVAGFSNPDAQGRWSGIDVDLCRAIASAIFNDPTKVRYVPLTSANRFTALQSGEVDLLSRNTTWTLSRDTSLGLDFPAVNYYDGQGFMVRRSLNVTSARQLDGASVCTQTGTTTELNLADYFRANNLRYEVVAFVGLDETVKAYEAGRCDVYTTDVSGLASSRLSLQNPNDHLILPEVISKEPLAPAVRQGDANWRDVVAWTHYAMVTAEELGITQANIAQMMTDARPEVKRFVGAEGGLGQMLGLPNDWAARIVRHVGNYGEVFDRNVGERTPLGLPRGVNQLWNRGGLQYAPPIR